MNEAATIERLVLIAGSGRLPQILAPYADEVASLVSSRPSVAPDREFRLETLGSFLSEIAAAGTTHVCLAGAIPRPTIDTARIDSATAPLVPRLAAALKQGDDTALRTALSLFEEAGISPLGAHELKPDLLPDEGLLTQTAPGGGDAEDTARAAQVLTTLGQADMGQACIVAGGQIIAAEAAPGTDWMLETVIAARSGGAPARAERSQRGSRIVEALDDVVGATAIRKRSEERRIAVAQDSTEGRALDPDTPLAVDLPLGGVLAKAPKPGQDRRADLPAIGPDTVRRAAAAGLSGIWLQHGGVMVLDPERCTELADASGLWIQVGP